MIWYGICLNIFSCLQRGIKILILQNIFLDRKYKYNIQMLGSRNLILESWSLILERTVTQNARPSRQTVDRALNYRRLRIQYEFWSQSWCKLAHHRSYPTLSLWGYKSPVKMGQICMSVWKYSTEFVHSKSISHKIKIIYLNQ